MSFTHLFLVLGPVLLAGNVPAFAQEEQTTVFLERKPLSLRSPERYQVPIALEAKTRVTLTAASSGPVKTVLAKLGDSVTSQAELVRLDAEELRLRVEREKAAIELAKVSGEGPAQAAAIAVAELDLKIAQLRLDRATVVAPFNGRVIDVAVVTGEYVRESEPLVTVIDDSILTARLPAERATAEVGETVPVTIEGQPYDAKITAVVPVEDRFESLRELFESVVTVVVEFDNATSQLVVGQTLRTGMMPRDPVAEVPNGAVSTDDNGVRRVFVIRDEVALSIPVQVLSPVGTTDTYIAGEFAVGDELVTAGAEQLVSGRRVVPADSAAAQAGSASGSTPTTKPNTAPRPNATGGF